MGFIFSCLPLLALHCSVTYRISLIWGGRVRARVRARLARARARVRVCDGAVPWPPRSPTPRPWRRAGWAWPAPRPTLRPCRDIQSVQRTEINSVCRVKARPTPFLHLFVSFSSVVFTYRQLIPIGKRQTAIGKRQSANGKWQIRRLLNLSYLINPTL